nr:F-box only protein 27-like [Setaria viridis]
MEEIKDVTRLLPDDALAAVLARLAPRGLATCRRVCKTWRAVVDTHRLLRTDLLPLSVGRVYLPQSKMLCNCPLPTEERTTGTRHCCGRRESTNCSGGGLRLTAWVG